MYHKLLIRLHTALIKRLTKDRDVLVAKRKSKLTKLIHKGNSQVISSSRKESQLSKRLHSEHRSAQDQLRNRHMKERRDLREHVTDLHAEMLELEHLS